MFTVSVSDIIPHFTNSIKQDKWNWSGTEYHIQCTHLFYVFYVAIHGTRANQRGPRCDCQNESQSLKYTQVCGDIRPSGEHSCKTCTPKELRVS